MAITPTATTLLITAGAATVFSVPPQTVITLTATVTSAGTPVNPGQVSFCNATAPLCTDVNRLGIAQLTAAGTATLSFVPGSGNHSYKAVFGGNANDSASSSSAQTLTVDSASTVTDSTRHPPTEIPSYLKANATNVLATAHLALGASNLSLTPGATYPTGQLPSATVTADFNGDGILDLAVTAFDSLGTYVPGSVAIFLGKGDGTFTAAPSLVTGTFPCCLVTGDFNGDGKIDLALGSDVDGSISIFLGNGDGTFTQGASIPGTFANVGALAVGDVNGDGIEDLVLSQPAADTLRIFLGHGDGTFTQVPETPSTGDNPLGIAVGDFNHDGHLDIAVCNVFPAPGSEAPSSVTVLLGKGDGTFTPAPSVPVGVAPEQILAADFNGNGKLDLAVLNIGLPTTISMLFGNGDGTFNSSSPQIPLPYLVSFALGDFNGDGKPDIGGFLEVYQPTNVNQNVYALINNGDGTFASITASDSLIPNGGVAGDFNGDGLSDLAVTGEYGGLSIYLTTVSGLANAATTTTLTSSLNPSTYGQAVTFTANATSASGTPTGSIIFADGGTQLGTVNLNANGVAQFTTSALTANDLGTTSYHLISATFSPGGNFTGSSAVLSQVVNGLPSTTTLVVTPTSGTASTSFTLTATVTSATPTSTTTPTGEVVFYSEDALNYQGSEIGYALLVNGVATLTTNHLLTSSDYVEGDYFGDNIYAYSASNDVLITITGAPPAIALTSSRNPAPALTAIAFTAQLPAGSGGTVIFAINGQNIATTPNAAGTATTTISTLTPGTYLITATWNATGHALGAQASLTQVVTAAVAAPDFSLTGTNITFPVLHSGTGDLELTSLNNFAGNVALTCNPPYPANYTCTLQYPSISLTAGESSVLTFTLNYSATATVRTKTRIVLAAFFPLTLLSLMGLARKRRTPLRAILSLALLAILATATTACGPDQFIPITTGTYPITFTATGTSQGTSTAITHTLTINAIITP
jgi:hypothetical protein